MNSDPSLGHYNKQSLLVVCSELHQGEKEERREFWTYSGSEIGGDMSGSDDNAWERRGNFYDLFERVNVKQVHPVTGYAECNIS